MRKICKKVNKRSIEIKEYDFTFPFGLKGLFEAHLAISKSLCDCYVIERPIEIRKLLYFNDFLCDAYVIDEQILFNGHLIKVK